MLPRLTHSQFPRIYPYTNMAKRRRRRRWEMERSESEKLPPSIHPSILEKNEKLKEREKYLHFSVGPFSPSDSSTSGVN